MGQCLKTLYKAGLFDLAPSKINIYLMGDFFSSTPHILLFLLAHINNNNKGVSPRPAKKSKMTEVLG